MREQWQPNVVVDPEIVTAHIEKQIPLPAGTAQVVWLMNCLLGGQDGGCDE